MTVVHVRFLLLIDEPGGVLSSLSVHYKIACRSFNNSVS